MKDKITRHAEDRIDKKVNEWVYERWDIVEPEMIESLIKMMQVEHCHGIITGHNIATAKMHKRTVEEETISTLDDALDGRR